MCGIFGFISDSPKTELEKLSQKMSDSLLHRGPDDGGHFLSDGFCIGNRRLSIVDIAGGHQPMFSEDRQIAIVQNGEIFNFVELSQELRSKGVKLSTQSDTEVLLRLYEREGLDFLSKLNGMFAIAIYDRRQKKLFLARDRLGVKPLYYTQIQGRFYFASEIKALLAAGPDLQVNLQINPQAIHDYLTLNYVPEPSTIYKGVFQLPAGSVATVSQEGMEIRSWWDLSRVQPETRTEADFFEELAALLEDSVKIRMRSDVPFGAFLSGGIDSSIIVALMAKLNQKTVQTFSVGFDDPIFDESKNAREVADLFKTDHHTCTFRSTSLDLWPQVLRSTDQPHGDTSFLPTLEVSRLAARHVKVVLTGDGADEIFGGYEKYFAADPRPEQFYSSNSIFSEPEKNSLYSAGYRETLNVEPTQTRYLSHFKQVRHQDPINQMLFTDIKTLLAGNNLVKPDRMGMAASIEARNPFLDYRIVELAFKMPGHLKIKNGISKYPLRTVASRWLPASVINRPKKMFSIPYEKWIDRFPKIDLAFLEPTKVQQLVLDARAGNKGSFRKLRALAALQLWSEQRH